jgi:signal transduction histidine kinase/CheY-like chemotaxis protein
MDQETTCKHNSNSQVLDSPLPSESSAMTHQVARLRLILEVSRSLNSTLDLDTLLGLIIKVATEVTSTEAASILLLDESTGELHFEASTNADPVRLRATPVPLESSIAGWIVCNNQPLVVNNTDTDPRYFSQIAHLTQFNVRSILGTPLQVKDKTIGVLEVLNKSSNSHFTQQDIDTLEALAAQAAIAIENARLYKDLHDQMYALQKAQARLVQSEKLAAVGELVAGVAHELNNPLTSIIGFAHLLLQGDLDEQSRKDLDKILVQARRAAGIVYGLLDFARQRPPEQKPIQVNGVLKSTLELLAYELRTSNIECVTNLSLDLPLTMADPYQLQQVFVNLVNNACQAMNNTNGGGHLTITTELGPATFIDRQASAGPAIRVSVQDDGPGIPLQLLSSIFDPFVTTKPEGQGTGLGLSVCHGIITEHGGHIWAESVPDQGATFFVELPVVAPDEIGKAAPRTRPGLPQKTAPDTPTPENRSRILVVDDEPDLLDFMTRALTREGYAVDTVSHAEQAMPRLAKTNYELIICDIRMPGLSGPELYRQVQAQDPDMARRFLFVTGDTVSHGTQEFLDKTGAPYLCKPFTLADLLEQLRRFLDTPKNGVPVICGQTKP